MKKLFHLLCLFALLQSCLGVAKVSDFETDAAAIDFDKHAQTYETSTYNQKTWTFETADDYYFERPLTISEEAFTKTTLEAFAQSRYYRLEKDLLKNRILGQRGLRANEWNTVSAVYYKFNREEQKIQVYVSTKITQDITGGYVEKRSMQLGQMIEKFLEIKKIRESRK